MDDYMKNSLELENLTIYTFMYHKIKSECSTSEGFALSFKYHNLS